jgi:hypothetical protein
MKVKYIKLLNGEELIAETTRDGHIVKLKNPVRLVLIPSKVDPKNPSIGLAPWAEFSEDKEIELDKAHILAIMNPHKDFINQYNSMFGGLITADTPKLILPGG